MTETIDRLESNIKAMEVIINNVRHGNPAGSLADLIPLAERIMDLARPSIISGFKVNKNGEKFWYISSEPTAQAAIETCFGVKVIAYDYDGSVYVFDDARDEVDQLYSAQAIAK